MQIGNIYINWNFFNISVDYSLESLSHSYKFYNKLVALFILCILSKSVLFILRIIVINVISVKQLFDKYKCNSFIVFKSVYDFNKYKNK